MTGSMVLSFTDPHAYQSAFFPSVAMELFPTARGKFSAELTQVRMKSLWTHCAHEDLPRVFIGERGQRRAAMGFLTKANQPALLHCGTVVSFGDIIITDTDLMYRRTEANCDWGSMSLPEDELDTSCQTLIGPEYAGLSLEHLVRPAPGLLAQLLRIHEMMGLLARITPDLFSVDGVIRALEQELTLVMIRCLTEGEPSRMTTRGRRHNMIIARFKEFLEAHPDQPLYLTDICAALGVAERTLRAACQEQLGMGPIRFLSLRRLHLVHRTLREADPSTTTVTRVATDHGFWELGRFSVAYRVLFGKSPSETLRGPSDDGPLQFNRPFSLGNPASRPTHVARGSSA